MKDITTEEAIKILKNEIQKYKESYQFQNVINTDIIALEKVLNELEEYNEGNIVAVKLLEKFNLISRDEKNQHSIANEDFFEKYVPKDIVKKKDKIIDAMAEYIDSGKYIDDVECEFEARNNFKCPKCIDCRDCIKQYYEGKVKDE